MKEEKLFVHSFRSSIGLIRLAATEKGLAVVSLPGESEAKFKSRLVKLFPLFGRGIHTLFGRFAFGVLDLGVALLKCVHDVLIGHSETVTVVGIEVDKKQGLVSFPETPMFCGKNGPSG